MELSSKEKAEITKHNIFLATMQWEIAEPYLDVKLCNGKGAREKQYITLREYKEKMIAGITHRQMKKSGVTKHLLNFFSNFCQGNVILSKDQFLKEYKEYGLDLKAMSKKYNISKHHLTFLRQLYDIKRTGFEYQNRKRTEKPITQRQKELIYGSLMGDAKKISPSSVGFGQAESQKSYAMWKFIEMESVASPASFKKYEQLDKRYDHIDISWRFYTKANSDIEKIITEFYGTGHKEVNQNILDNLTPFSVAVWFMDDGMTDMHRRHKKNKNYHYNFTPVCAFCTDSFSYESHLLMQKWFKEKWDINVRLKEAPLKDRMGYRIIICNEDTQKFIDLIKPHILPHFLYKIDYDEYIKHIGERPYDIEKALKPVDTSNLVNKDSLAHRYDFLTEEILRTEYIMNELTDAQIATKYNVGSKTVIWRKRKAFGIKNRCPGKSNNNATVNRKFDISEEDAKIMINQRMGYKEIAEKMGCSEMVVKRRFKEMGLSTMIIYPVKESESIFDEMN